MIKGLAAESSPGAKPGDDEDGRLDATSMDKQLESLKWHLYSDDTDHPDIVPWHREETGPTRLARPAGPAGTDHWRGPADRPAVA
jgi:hypothetical protein